MLLIPILALLPLLLYITIGYGGHDFKYHATAWLALHDAWSAHEWSFGWSPWAHHGFGEPSFCFYPPLSLLIGTGLTFLMPFRFVPGVVVWLLLTISGLSMYKAAGRFLAPQYRLPAALLYMFNPYLLMTVVIRFAIAEAWTQALLPLAFLYFYVLIAEDRLPLLFISASLLAAAWLANISAAIGIFYAFAFLAILIAFRRRSSRPLLLAALSQLCAILFASFRLLPTFAEKSWVSSQSLLIYNFRSYMQLKRVPPPHLMVYLSGVYIALSLALIVPAVQSILRRDRQWRTPILAFLAIAAFAVCFQLPITTPLWAHLPQFKFILFPYRLLPLLALGSLLLIYSDGVTRNLRRAAVITLAIFALFPFFSYGRILPSQRFRFIAAAVASWQTGFEGVREYVPVTVPLPRAEPPVELELSKQGPFASPACAPAILATHPDQRLLRTTSATPCTLLLNTYYYPFWHAHLDGNASLPITPDPSGLIQIPVPQGTHQVSLSFVPQTRTRTIATATSLLTVFIVLLGSWLTRRHSFLRSLFDASPPLTAEEPQANLATSDTGVRNVAEFSTPPPRRNRTLLLLMVLLSTLAFLAKGFKDEHTVLKFRDFKQPYASARCLLHGCNPYSETDTRAEFLRAGGSDNDAQVFRPYSALYPPFSFALLAPLAALNYHAAHTVWFWTIGLLFSTAVLLIADLCLAGALKPSPGPGPRPGIGPGLATTLLLSAFTLTSTILLMEGQISGPVIALLAIGFWCLLRERLPWVAILAFTIALVLKPHDSALLVCYLLFAGARWRRVFWLTAALTAVIVVAGTLWCAHQPASAHWLADLTANLKGNAGAGGANDPTRGSLEAINMANLQPLFAAETRNERLYNSAAQGLTLLLLAAWALPAWRMRNTLQKHILAIAAMACIMLLPIYHRQYDTRVLLLVFPAVALLLVWRTASWGLPGLALLAIATVATTHTYLNRLTLHHDAIIKAAGPLKTVLLYRPLPIIELLLALFLVAAFHARYRASLHEAV